MITVPPASGKFFFVIGRSFRQSAMPGSLDNRRMKQQEPPRRGCTPSTEPAHQLCQGFEPHLSYRNKRLVKKQKEKAKRKVIEKRRTLNGANKSGTEDGTKDSISSPLAYEKATTAIG